MVSKNCALLLERAGAQQLAQVHAVGAAERMGDADEAAEHAVAVGIAREDRDAAAAELMQRAAFPVGAALRIEMRRDQPIIGRDIGLVVGRAEEAVERFP